MWSQHPKQKHSAKSYEQTSESDKKDLKLKETSLIKIKRSRFPDIESFCSDCENFDAS